MSQQFKKGDKVEWSSGQGTSTGTVQKRITDSTEVDGNSISASKEDPRYLVENDNTGTVTGHKPSALSKVNESNDESKENSSKKSSDGSSKHSNSEHDEKIKEFEEAVNMTAKEIADWLKTDESKSVGQEDKDGNIKGRKSGKDIIEIIGKNKSDYTDDDIERIEKVVAYVHRHLAQKPSSDIENSDWRYSLMNWGHDPCKG
ncbi:MAG: HVA1 family protein [Cyanobacteria bacterium P01_D01_bin.1]